MAIYSQFINYVYFIYRLSINFHVRNATNPTDSYRLTIYNIVKKFIPFKFNFNRYFSSRFYYTELGALSRKISSIRIDPSSN